MRIDLRRYHPFCRPRIRHRLISLRSGISDTVSQGFLCSRASLVLSRRQGTNLRNEREMLALSFLLLIQSQATLSFVHQSITRPTFSRPGARMPSRNPVLQAAEPCADIEELPAAFVKGYQQHQAVTYHTFTADEVGRYLAWICKEERFVSKFVIRLLQQHIYCRPQIQISNRSVHS